jgi:hypothetical protein
MVFPIVARIHSHACHPKPTVFGCSMSDFSDTEIAAILLALLPPMHRGFRMARDNDAS